MTIIYEPKGKAFEYSPLAANLYSGCAHRCEYCYVPNVPPFKFKPREEFYRDPQPRKDIIHQFEKSAVKFAGDKRPVLFSFTSDAYQPIEKAFGITAQAIEICAANRLRPQILTKAGDWAIRRDWKLHKAAGTIWAATLTTDDNQESLQWEPEAALPEERIDGLRIAHKIGLETWVSFEPVINPEAVYRMIEKTHTFVDLYKIGKLNYHPHADTIDWHDFLITVEKHLDAFGCNRYIKKDLEHYRTSTAA
jgi:DNA repair photolyase